MSEEHKRRVQQALERHHENKLEDDTQPKRKNKKPEKQTEEQCLKWMKEMGFEVQIIESKAVYNPRAGRYTQNQSVKSGNADCQGIMPDGTSIAVEFKAPGKLGSFLRDGNERQRDFIIKRIYMNGFACVVDTVELLISTYNEWFRLREQSSEQARQYLLDQLPVRSRQTKADNDLGF